MTSLKIKVMVDVMALSSAADTIGDVVAAGVKEVDSAVDVVAGDVGVAVAVDVYIDVADAPADYVVVVIVLVVVAVAALESLRR